MTLADDVLTELKSKSTNPTFVTLTREAEALCTVIERRIAAQNRVAAMSDLKERDLDMIPLPAFIRNCPKPQQ